MAETEAADTWDEILPPGVFAPEVSYICHSCRGLYELGFVGRTGWFECEHCYQTLVEINCVNMHRGRVGQDGDQL